MGNQLSNDCPEGFRPNRSRGANDTIGPGLFTLALCGGLAILLLTVVNVLLPKLNKGAKAGLNAVSIIMFLIPAIELLKKSLGHCNDHVVHTELAKVYIKNAEYGLAIEHCQHALAYAPYYEDAKDAFDRAERGLKGLDPDGDQEEENDGDDGGDDSF